MSQTVPCASHPVTVTKQKEGGERSGQADSSLRVMAHFSLRVTPLTWPHTAGGPRRRTARSLAREGSAYGAGHSASSQPCLHPVQPPFPSLNTKTPIQTPGVGGGGGGTEHGDNSPYPPKKKKKSTTCKGAGEDDENQEYHLMLIILTTT